MAVDPNVITLTDIQNGKEDICFLEQWIETTSLTLFTPDGKEVQTLEGISSNSQVAANTAQISLNTAAIASLAGVAPIAVTQYTSPGAGSHNWNISTRNYLVITIAGGGGGGGAGTDAVGFAAAFGDCAGGGGGSGAVSMAWGSGGASLSNSPYTVGAGGAAGIFSNSFGGSVGGNSIFQAPGGGPTIAGSFGGGGGAPGWTSFGSSGAGLSRGGFGGTITAAIGDITLPGRSGSNANITGFAGVTTNGILTNGSIVNMIGGVGAGGFSVNGTGNGGTGGSFLDVSDPTPANRTPTAASAGSSGSIIVLEYE